MSMKILDEDRPRNKNTFGVVVFNVNSWLYEDKLTEIKDKVGKKKWKKKALKFSNK